MAFFKWERYLMLPLRTGVVVTPDCFYCESCENGAKTRFFMVCESIGKTPCLPALHRHARRSCFYRGFLRFFWVLGNKNAPPDVWQGFI